MSFTQFKLLLFTLRHVKFSQILWRIRHRFFQKAVDTRNCHAKINPSFNLISHCQRPISFADNAFLFLNHRVDRPNHIDWNDSKQSKLWLYNLHYFDVLHQPDLEDNTGFKLINEWIENNPHFKGNGWEPYPLSLRIVNWIKFLQHSDYPQTEVVLNSLFLQTRSLNNKIEYHLLGNHLFKNGVALLFAGYFFKGEEAKQWLATGKQILIEQLAEQVLADGGHFERSPMYHALILEDILDCLNLVTSSQVDVDAEFKALLELKANAMLEFMMATLHKDGSYPVFNDTAQGIASNPQQLLDYANRLQLSWISNADSLIEKPDFGLYILSSKKLHCIIDAGPIGPDYLPGHAHCDTLSFELSIEDLRVIVNAGVYQYAGSERNNYRATSAHNTVEIDNAEQHEIWSTFRVARRGYPQNIITRKDDDQLFFSGQHTGYHRLSGKPTHQRDITLKDNRLNIKDCITGKGQHSAKSFIHFHPDVELIEQYENGLQLKRDHVVFNLMIHDAKNWTVDQYNYSEQFGLQQSALLVTVQAAGTNIFGIEYSIEKNYFACSSTVPIRETNSKPCASFSSLIIFHRKSTPLLHAPMNTANTGSKPAIKSQS